MYKILDLLKPLMEEWGSDPGLQPSQPHSGSERGSGRQDHLLAAAKELQQAWGRSLHCQLQLQTRLEMILDWALDLQQDGGILGEENNNEIWKVFARGHYSIKSSVHLFIQCFLKLEK